MVGEKRTERKYNVAHSKECLVQAGVDRRLDPTVPRALDAKRNHDNHYGAKDTYESWQGVSKPNLKKLEVASITHKQ